MKQIYPIQIQLGLLSGLALSLMTASAAEPGVWTISGGEDWKKSLESSKGIVIEEDTVSPEGQAGILRTKRKVFPAKRSVTSLTLRQSDLWQNWKPTENLGPTNLRDAPVLLTMGPDNYWIFGRYGDSRKRSANKKKGQSSEFSSQPAKLEGFEIPLRTTPFPRQFDAPGGLRPGKGGYHAWQSRDMIHWVHHGPVTEGFSKWVTSGLLPI